MAEHNLLEILSARILGVSPDAGADEISQAYREKVARYHPDVNDDPEAVEMFKAVDTAQSILMGEIDFRDPDSIRTAEEQVKGPFSESEIEEAAEESSKSRQYTSKAKKRSSPSDYSVEDFMGMSGEARKEMVEDVALGIETMIIYNAVGTLYENSYTEADFFNDINQYIGEEHPDSIGFEDYYEATKDNTRRGVTEEKFLSLLEEVQQNLQSKYPDGTTLRDVARAIATFTLQGGLNLGFSDKFVGDSRFGRDSRFSRGRRSSGSFGRDERFDR